MLSHSAFQQALQERETIYRALVEAMPDLVFRIRGDGTYLEFKVPDGLGIKIPTIQEIVGKKIANVVPPHVTELAMPAIERVLKTRQPETIYYQIEETTGPHDYQARFVASLENEIIAVVHDITARIRAEESLRIQRDLGIALSTVTQLDQALDLMMDAALQITLMDCGGLYLVDPSSKALYLASHRGLSNEFIAVVSYYEPDTPQALRVMQGQPVYTNYRDLGFPSDDARQSENLRAFGMVPILHDNQVIACINVASHARDEFPIWACHALESIASRIGSTMARIRAEEARRESEATTRALLNASRDIALLVDEDWTVLAVSEPAASAMDSTVEAMIGTCVLDYMPPHIAQDRKTKGAEVFRTGKSVQFQDTNLQQRHFDHLVYPLFNTRHEVTRLAIFARDITEQKRDKEDLLRKDQLLEGIAKAAGRLLATGEYEKVFKSALGLLGEAAQVERVFVYENLTRPDPDEPLMRCLHEWVNPLTGFEENCHLHQNSSWRALGVPHWHDQLASGQAIIASPDELDLINRHHAPPRTLSLLIVPIFARDIFWGCIGFDNRLTAHNWSSKEISALQIIAASVAAAIERQRAEAQLREQHQIAETLIEVGNILNSTLALDEVLDRILQQARRVVPYDAASMFLFRDGFAYLEHPYNYETYGLNEQELKQVRLSIEQSPYVRRLAQDRVPIISVDVQSDPDWITTPSSYWIGSWMGVPIVVRDEVIGYFSLNAEATHFYNERHIELIIPFARQAGMAVSNALLFEDIQKLEQTKSDMIRMASHDLRSPLTSIKGSVQQINNHPTALSIPLWEKECGRLHNAVYEMEQIIDHILSLERIEAQHRAAKPVDWCDLLAKSLESVRADLETRHHQISVQCDSDLPLTRGDPLQLQRSMINLLGNAIKYTPHGGHIQVRLYRHHYGQKPTIAFEVKDNGIGIPPEEQPQLFEPFYRASHTENVPGLGLGLSVVRAAIKSHKGNVYVDSEPGNGSVFGFWVPI
jgi:PAS domain S-box-containing protein